MSQTVIVFEEDCILAAAGREGRNPAVSEVRRIELQGQGDSFARWQQALNRLKTEWKTEQARLVLPANLCSTRVLTLPYSRGRQLGQMAQKEVADSFGNDMADFSVLYSDKKSGVDLCAGGVEKGNLERFLEICKQAQIAVRGITVPLEGSLRLLQPLSGFQDSTAVYLFFEGEGMTSILCQNGRHLYSSRSRLFSEPGTLDFGTEIVRNISGILQFYAGRRGEEKITKVYYAGCPAEDFLVSEEGIRNLNLTVEPMAAAPGVVMPAGQKTEDWLPCIGALMQKGKKEKQIDLCKIYRESEKKAEKPVNLARHLAAPGAALLLCLAASAGVWILNGTAQRENDEKQAWIQDAAVQEQYLRAQMLQAGLTEIEGAIASVKRTDENLSVYPDWSSRILARIESVGGNEISLRVNGYDAGSGILTFQANSRQVIDIPAYIRKLQETGLFHAVDYTGYSYDNDWYTLSLSCTLEGKRSEQIRQKEDGQ